MSEKARGALFNALGDITGLSVLDAFTGSGALGLEALSRGAARVTAVDIDKNAQRMAQENAAALGLKTGMKVVRANISGWSDNNPLVRFDLILADPPHDKLRLPVLEKLVRHLATNGIYVLNWPGKTALPVLAGLSLAQSHNYGDTQLAFYKLTT
jgi:16S rRNA (guanine966-N2)-methyltransferase